jgi:hypothetical protein
MVVKARVEPLDDVTVLGYRLVTSTMQRTLTGLDKKRRFPVIG